ncbi:MAG: hypothetical protein ACOCTG_05960, partial [Bacteroidota bacterium]
PLPRLLADADLWLRSPQTLAVWSFAAFLFVLPPVAALLASLTVFLGWQVVGPLFVHLSLLPIFRVMDAVLLQGLVYVIVLSIFASNGVFSVVWIGVAGFILYRWGIAGRLLASLLRRLQASLYDLPLPDQVLRGMILRTALRNDISLPQIQIIERRIRQKWK